MERQDLNLQPFTCKANIEPIELQPHIFMTAERFELPTQWLWFICSTNWAMLSKFVKYKYPWQGSNLQPFEPKSNTLPIELQRLMNCKGWSLQRPSGHEPDELTTAPPYTIKSEGWDSNPHNQLGRLAPYH